MEGSRVHREKEASQTNPIVYSIVSPLVVINHLRLFISIKHREVQFFVLNKPLWNVVYLYDTCTKLKSFHLVHNFQTYRSTVDFPFPSGVLWQFEQSAATRSVPRDWGRRWPATCPRRCVPGSWAGAAWRRRSDKTLQVFRVSTWQSSPSSLAPYPRSASRSPACSCKDRERRRPILRRRPGRKCPTVECPTCQRNKEAIAFIRTILLF